MTDRHCSTVPPGRRRVAVAHVYVSPDREGAPVEVQMRAIQDACERRIRSPHDILWITDTGAPPDQGTGDSTPGLTLVRDLISRGTVRCLVMHECAHLAATPKVAQDLLDNYLAPSNVQFISVVERINSRRDLARFIEHAKDGLTEALAAQWRRNISDEPRPRKSQLSPRQTLLLQLKAQGMTTREVAHRMGISPHSIHGLLSRICKRLGMASVRDAIAAAKDSQWPASSITEPKTCAEPIAAASQPSTPRERPASKPVAPLTPEHVRLLELLSTGLTTSEVAVHLEIEPERAMALRRQAYLRLGVTNLDDAVRTSGIDIPEERPIRPNRARRRQRLSRQERQDKMHQLLDELFGSLRNAWGDQNALGPDGDDFPDELWMLRYPASGTHYQVRLNDHPWALACFSSSDAADAFVEALSDEAGHTDGCVPTRLFFDEARDIAKAKDDVQALVLLDDPTKPRWHYVR